MSVGDRSWIDGYDVEHLLSAATHWTEMGQLLEYHAEGIYSETLHPGGTRWEGPAADTAADRAWGDVVTARGAADAMYNAAGIARNGADDLMWAKRQAQQSITDAESAGFTVSEDKAVTDTTSPLMRQSAARQAQQQAFAADIAAKTQALVEMDQQVAAQISAAGAPLQGLSFGQPTVKAVSYGTVNDAPADTGKDQPSPVSKFHQDGIEEGGTAGNDPAHNAQGIRGDEGVLINRGRIMFGDTAELTPDGKFAYLHAPMYDYHLDSKGMPILDSAPVTMPERGIPGDHRIIPTGGTGPEGMPNGTNLLFGKEWKLSPDQTFPNETQVFDTRGVGQFPKVATIPGIRDMTAIPYGNNQLLISGVQTDGKFSSRGVWVTPAQSAPGNYGFLDPKTWTPMGSFQTQQGLAAEPTASLFHVDTPTGSQYGMITANATGNGMDMRIASTPEQLAQAPPTPIVAPGERPGTYLYSPNVTQIIQQPGGGYQVDMTFSERMAPNGVAPGDLGPIPFS